MAGRPRTGSVWQRGEKWVVTLTPDRGSRRRVTASFNTKDEAQRWRAASISALDDGLPLPAANNFRLVPTPKGPELSTFAEVAAEWYHQNFEVLSDDLPSPKHCDRVRHDLACYILPYFAARTNRVDEVTSAMVRAWLDHLSGRFLPGTVLTVETVPNGHFTISQIATMTGLSVPTIRRRLRSGEFPRAYRANTGRGVQGTWFIPATDVKKAGLSMNSSKTTTPTILAKNTASGCLKILRDVLEHARGLRLMDHDPTEGLRARTPVNGASSHKKAPTAEARLFDLEESIEVAGHLNIHHKVVFWLIRAAGLRSGEAFGTRLDDLTYEDGRYVLHVRRQGGKRLYERRADGSITPVSSVNRTKGVSGTRILPLSRPLSALLRVYIDAYHSESVPETPLVVTTPFNGYSYFRGALKDAYRRTGLDIADVGFAASTHHLRKCFSTELAFSGVSEPLRSQYLGHKLRGFGGGADVTARVYTLSVQKVSALLPVAEAHESRIAAEIGSLMAPAPASSLLPPVALEGTEADVRVCEVLEQAGLIAQPLSEESSTVTVTEAMEILGMSRSTVRRLIVDGTLESRTVNGPTGVPAVAITLKSLEEFRDIEFKSREAGMLGLSEVCVLADVWPAKVLKIAELLDITPVKAERSGTVWFSADDAARIVQRQEHATELLESAMSLSRMAKLLRINYQTASRLVANGLLEVDAPATEALGCVMVTRASVDRELERRRRRRVTATIPPGFVHIAEVQERLGLTRFEVLALSHQGVEIHRTKDYQFYLTESVLNEVPDRDTAPSAMPSSDGQTETLR